jgi:hypothetical protein
MEKQDRNCKHFVRAVIRDGQHGPALWVRCRNCPRQWFLTNDLAAFAEWLTAEPEPQEVPEEGVA